MDELEPPHRIQKRPLPESAPVLAAAKQRRQAWQEAMSKVTRSAWTEHEREARQEALDICQEDAYDY